MKEENSNKENLDNKEKKTVEKVDNKAINNKYNKKTDNAKKKDKEKSKTENKKDKQKNKKEKPEKTNKFIETIKKKWLIDGTKTFLLVAIIIAIFIGISVIMQKQNFTPIDLTADKLFTLTDESKEQVKNIQDKVNIYFVGYKEDDTTLDLARQYTKANENITVEAVTSTDRPDLANK